MTAATGLTPRVLRLFTLYTVYDCEKVARVLGVTEGQAYRTLRSLTAAGRLKRHGHCHPAQCQGKRTVYAPPGTNP